MTDDSIQRSGRVNRRKFLTGVGAGVTAGLAGCTEGEPEQTDTPTESPEPTDEPVDTPTEAPTETSGVKMGGELIATFGADVKNYDPTQQNDTTSTKATGLIYETLLSTDFNGKPQPVLATSLEQTGDLTFRASLREGVTFHNGSDFTADDVKASFERYEGTPREADVYDWYDSSEIVDDYTIDITLQDAYAPFKFSLGGVPIVPSEVVDGDVDLTQEPIGSGPYAFDTHEPDSLFRVTRNDDHWFEGDDSMPETPPIETVTWRIIVEQSAQLAALQGGDVDLINGPPAASVADLRENEDFKVTARTAGGFDMFVYPMQVEPFDNQNIRHGITRLIPREAIVDSVYDGIGEPAYAPISPLAAQFTSSEFQQEMKDQYAGYDPDQAAQLLEQGFSEAGVEKPFKTEIITNENPQRVKWCQLIQESMNSSGFFDVELNQFEWNTYVGKILAEDSNTKNQIVAVGWSAGWDPDAYVHNLFHSETFTPACCNINHYMSEEIDDLIDQGLQTYDLAERNEIYTELQRKVVEVSPMAFIRFGKEMDAFVDDTVKGFNTYPINGGEFNGIYAPYSGTFTWVDK